MNAPPLQSQFKRRDSLLASVGDADESYSNSSNSDLVGLERLAQGAAETRLGQAAYGEQVAPPKITLQEQEQQDRSSLLADRRSAQQQVSVACQTEPNLIDKLIDNHIKRQLDDVDLYQDYVRSAQCTQFWPLDKNPIRLLVPTMLKVDLPEQHLRNESLMFDLVQAITTNSKLVNLLAKYIHHIVPNVIISKRIDLIPLITCTIRVCPDKSEQERLMSLLFNLIKRPNEEQRRMILSGIIVVLQVSPHQTSSLLLPNLWDYVQDKFPERRILLAESCAALAHYVRPIMRTNLVLSILIQLLKDKHAQVRLAACKSFACLLTLIMDRNDEVFDACLSAFEDIVQDMLLQTPTSVCEHRYELEQMRYCILETIYPLISMWAVKLNRFKLEMAEFYLTKAENYFASLLNSAGGSSASSCNSANGHNRNMMNSLLAMSSNSSSSSSCSSAATNSSATLSSSATITSPTTPTISPPSNLDLPASKTSRASLVAAAVSKRRTMFFESRHAASFCSSLSSSSSSAAAAATPQAHVTSGYSSSGLGSSFSSSLGSVSPPVGKLSASDTTATTASTLRRKSAFVGTSSLLSGSDLASANSSAQLAGQRAVSAHLRMLSYMVPFVFSDAVHSCAWLTKSKLHLPDEQQAVSEQQNNNNWPQSMSSSGASDIFADSTNASETTSNKFSYNGDFACDDEAGVRSVKFANKLLEPTLIVDESAIIAFHEQLKQEHMTIDSISWLTDKFLIRLLDVLAYFSHKKFHLIATGNTSEIVHELLFTIIGCIRQLCLLFGKHLTRSKLRPLIKRYVATVKPAVFFLNVVSLTAFEPIEQAEFEEILADIRQNLSHSELTRNDVENFAISVKIIATSSEQIHSPSTRQKFLTYVLDALVTYSNQIKLTGQAKEFMLIIFRHILTCLIDPQVRPADWAHILVTKFLPLLILLANDSSDVYVCTYARLMCAQLVDSFDSHLSSPKLTQQTASSIMPALNSLKSLTEQIKASNLKRQIDCLTNALNEKFFKQEQQQSPHQESKGSLKEKDRLDEIATNAPIGAQIHH